MKKTLRSMVAGVLLASGMNGCYSGKAEDGGIPLGSIGGVSRGYYVSISYSILKGDTLANMSVSEIDPLTESPPIEVLANPTHVITSTDSTNNGSFEVAYLDHNRKRNLLKNPLQRLPKDSRIYNYISQDSLRVLRDEVVKRGPSFRIKIRPIKNHPKEIIRIASLKGSKKSNEAD